MGRPGNEASCGQHYDQAMEVEYREIQTFTEVYKVLLTYSCGQQGDEVEKPDY